MVERVEKFDTACGLVLTGTRADLKEHAAVCVGCRGGYRTPAIVETPEARIAALQRELYEARCEAQRLSLENYGLRTDHWERRWQRGTAIVLALYIPALILAAIYGGGH